MAFPPPYSNLRVQPAELAQLRALENSVGLANDVQNEIAVHDTLRTEVELARAQQRRLNPQSANPRDREWSRLEAGWGMFTFYPSRFDLSSIKYEDVELSSITQNKHINSITAHQRVWYSVYRRLLRLCYVTPTNNPNHPNLANPLPLPYRRIWGVLPMYDPPARPPPLPGLRTRRKIQNKPIVPKNAPNPDLTIPQLRRLTVNDIQLMDILPNQRVNLKRNVQRAYVQLLNDRVQDRTRRKDETFLQRNFPPFNTSAGGNWVGEKVIWKGGTSQIGIWRDTTAQRMEYVAIKENSNANANFQRESNIMTDMAGSRHTVQLATG